MDDDKAIIQQKSGDLDKESGRYCVYGWFVTTNLARDAYCTMLWVGYSLGLAMLPFSHVKMIELLILTIAYLPTIFTCMFLPLRKVQMDWMHPRIQWTALLTLLSCGALLACCIISSHQASDARYLVWLWRGAAFGMVLTAIALFVQPSRRHLHTSSILWIIVGDACVLAMVLVLRDTMVALTVADLHLIIANILLTNDAGGPDAASRDSWDEHWLEGRKQNW